MAASSVPTLSAALVAAGAAISVGALNFLSQHRVLTQQREQLERQLGEQRAGQLTERLTRAVEQLGNEKPAVRLGGIYALGQIAKASQLLDRGDIYEILTAFVQVHAHWPPRHRDHQPAEGDQPAENHPRPKLPELWEWVPDVQAAMNVLARREFEPTDEGGRLRLVAVDLRRAGLRGANLQHANLRDACLQRAVLQGAYLEDAIFRDARLEGADLKDAHLQEADLSGANLESANLRGANLEGAKNLERCNLNGAWDNSRTTWPVGFIARDHGVIREESRA